MYNILKMETQNVCTILHCTKLMCFLYNIFENGNTKCEYKIVQQSKNENPTDGLTQCLKIHNFYLYKYSNNTYFECIGISFKMGTRITLKKSISVRGITQNKDSHGNGSLH